MIRFSSNNIYPPADGDPKKQIGYLVCLLLALLFCWLLSGCRTVKYVPVVETDTIIRADHDTTFVEHIRMDSVYVHDSIFQTIFQRGDTVYNLKTIDHITYRDRSVHDTILSVRTDTLYRDRLKTETVEVEVEKKLSWWQKTQQWVGKVVTYVLLAALVFGLLALLFIYGGYFKEKWRKS